MSCRVPKFSRYIYSHDTNHFCLRVAMESGLDARAAASTVRATIKYQRSVAPNCRVNIMSHLLSSASPSVSRPTTKKAVAVAAAAPVYRCHSDRIEGGWNFRTRSSCRRRIVTEVVFSGAVYGWSLSMSIVKTSR